MRREGGEVLYNERPSQSELPEGSKGFSLDGEAVVIHCALF